MHNNGKNGKVGFARARVQLVFIYVCLCLCHDWGCRNGGKMEKEDDVIVVALELAIICIHGAFWLAVLGHQTSLQRHPVLRQQSLTFWTVQTKRNTSGR